MNLIFFWLRAAGLVLLINNVSLAATIVCLTVEDPNNYDAVNFLESFTAKELVPAGHRVTIIEGNKVQPTHFDGLIPALQQADLLIVFVRRATPPQEQLDAIGAHLAAGKPLLGIRTANHAFSQRPSDPPPPAGCATWPEFTPLVLGGENTGYETKGMPYRVTLHPNAKSNDRLLQGVNVSDIVGHQSLYKVLPLAPDASPLLLGTATDIEPAQPVAWTRLYGPAKARVFYTSLGAPEEADGPAFRRLIMNAVNWSLNN